MHNSSNKLTFEQRLFWLSLLGALPSSIFLIWLLYEHQYSGYMVALVVLYLFAHIGICAYQIKFSIVTQFRTLTNLLEALSNDDYSLRGRKNGKTGALNELVAQINSLSDLLARQRFTVKETQLLLAKVIAHIDVAVFTFDAQNCLTLVNRAGADLYQKDIDELRNMSISKLGLEGMLARNGQVVELTFGEAAIQDEADLTKKNGSYKENGHFQSGRFHISTDQFIERNEHHTLLFLTNVHAALREEERKAWQNLIRVISHELNNSLAPIASISQTLMQMSVTEQNVLKESLGVINERANSLSAFIQSYQQLAKLPAPNLQTLDIKAEIEQVTALFPDVIFKLKAELKSELKTDKKNELNADQAQLRQLLINLFKNAQEASKQENQDAKVFITIDWKSDKDYFTLTILDNGPGIKNQENIFVPFYSTKPGGSGIGLLLCRQIAEGHGGQLSLTNAREGGCIASLRIQS